MLKNSLQMKKVLLAIGSSELGGAQNVFLDTALGVLKGGLDLVVLAPPGPLIDRLNEHQIKVYVYDYKITSLMKLFTFINVNDFVLINTFLAKCSIITCLVNIFFKIPICCTLLNPVKHIKLNRFQNFIYPYLYLIIRIFSNGVITNSIANKSHLMEVCGFKDEFIQVIYAGISINLPCNKEFKIFPKDPSLIKILISGRISKEKGHIYLFEALTLIEDINYECWVLGDGPEISALKEYVDKSSIKDRIKFYGFKTNVMDYMKRADILMVPSINEAFGLTILEGFSEGVLVIGSDVGGIPELIKNDITGILIPIKNPQAIAEAIINVLNMDKNHILKIINQAFYCCLNQYSKESMINNTIIYYDKILYDVKN